MKIVYEYSHLGGSEILKVRYPNHEVEIYKIIAGVEASKTKLSREKTKQDKLLYSPVDINKQFHKAFTNKGYKLCLVMNYTNKCLQEYLMVNSWYMILRG